MASQKFAWIEQIKEVTSRVAMAPSCFKNSRGLVQTTPKTPEETSLIAQARLLHESCSAVLRATPSLEDYLNNSAFSYSIMYLTIIHSEFERLLYRARALGPSLALLTQNDLTFITTARDDAHKLIVLFEQIKKILQPEE